MAIQIKRQTLEDFEAFIQRPENADRMFEFIGGEIVEMPSNPYSSEIAGVILFFIRLYLHENNIQGHVTGEAGLYQVMGERYAPDVAYLSVQKQSTLPYYQGYNPGPPDLAVEVVSPTDKPQQQNTKIGNYLAAGTLVWVVYPDSREVQIFQPGQAVRTLGLDDTLEGGEILPGLSIAVRDIFPPQGDAH